MYLIKIIFQKSSANITLNTKTLYAFSKIGNKTKMSLLLLLDNLFVEVLATKNRKNKSERKVKGWKEIKLPLFAYDNHLPRKAKKDQKKTS